MLSQSYIYLSQPYIYETAVSRALCCVCQSFQKAEHIRCVPSTLGKSGLKRPHGSPPAPEHFCKLPALTIRFQVCVKLLSEGRGSTPGGMGLDSHVSAPLLVGQP